MPDNAHDSPQQPFTPPGYEPEPEIPREVLAVLNGPGHEKYALMKTRLGAEPLEVIRMMKHGGYRHKAKRGHPGILVLDRDGSPVGERMSFRQIAPILAQMTGVQVTYETVRRWWEAVFPGEPDEPEDVPELDESVPSLGTEVRKVRVTRRRTPVVPVVGDDHADVIRAAVERAKSTNPDIPPAVFLPVADTQ